MTTISPSQISRFVAIAIILIVANVLASCQIDSGKDGGSQIAASIVIVETAPKSESNSNATPVLTSDIQPPTVTPLPTMTSSLTPSSTTTDKPTPSPTPIGVCNQRNPGDDLLTLVTRDYGLSRDFVPYDLVDISDYLPQTVTLGYPTRARRITMEPLQKLIDDMIADGLYPQIISGYRGYSAQAIAWSKWQNEVPETAAIISAPPGHSEHQLGTTFDFGSPELPEIVGVEDIQFHTHFYKTSEGQWLLENAHEYGFTLSYPRETFEMTGFFYEPWHYRYIGTELATQLKNDNLTLFEYLSTSQEAPCIP
jgi:D-alanyl-D-alanine carboxypeptidase